MKQDKTVKELKKRIKELEYTERQCLNIIEMLSNNVMLYHKYGLDKRLEDLVEEELKEKGFENEIKKDF